MERCAGGLGKVHSLPTNPTKETSSSNQDSPMPRHAAPAPPPGCSPPHGRARSPSARSAAARECAGRGASSWPFVVMRWRKKREGHGGSGSGRAEAGRVLLLPAGAVVGVMETKGRGAGELYKPRPNKSTPTCTPLWHDSLPTYHCCWRYPRGLEAPAADGLHRLAHRNGGAGPPRAGGGWMGRAASVCGEKREWAFSRINRARIQDLRSRIDSPQARQRSLDPPLPGSAARFLQSIVKTLSPRSLVDLRHRAEEGKGGQRRQGCKQQKEKPPSSRHGVRSCCLSHV